MANQRLFFLVCLASITLFSFNCAAPTNGTVSSEVNKEELSANTSNPVTSTAAPQGSETKPTTPTLSPPTDRHPDPTTPTTKAPTTPTTHTPTTPTTHTPTTVTTPGTSTITPTSSTKPTPEPSTTTLSPPTTASPGKHDRSFDLPSFIGGVILALGLAAIGYVVYKFYKTRTDPNYRSL